MDYKILTKTILMLAAGPAMMGVFVFLTSLGFLKVMVCCIVGLVVVFLVGLCGVATYEKLLHEKKSKMSNN